ncbi:hypothetical protein [Nocardia nova]|uniref:Uncharacterized protein n=1 Tax=Nocardia nova TaxID=37330 RepID=A0A2S6A547_9NOCA|nr:hypothetical protein [Nocardia nova]PPJ27228.1 hypothetical protein C5F51_18475 [Nocardia nova]
MSDNEIDQIGRDTGRVFRQVIDVARTYIHRRREQGRNAGVPRLSRAERRELAEQIRSRVGEQRVTEAWFAKRVEDYRRESIALRQRMRRTAGVAMDDENARLDAMRYSIESTLPSTGLSLEQRGQIVQAMDRFDVGQVDRPFYGPELFRTPVGRAAQQAREAAVQSERWVSERRAAIEQALPDHRDLAAREAAVRTVDPERAVRQGVAVQDLRHVQAVAREYGESRDVRAGRRIATARACAAGLTSEQVRWELDNAETNSRAQVTITAGRPGERDWTWNTYHPTEAEAARWTRDAVTETDWRPGTTLTVKAREAGNPKAFYTVEGNQAAVGRDLELWHLETRDGFGHTQQPAQEQPARAVAPDNDLAIEHSRVVAELDRLRGDVDSLKARLNLSIGHNGRLDEQNSDLTRQLTQLTAERDRLRGERDEAVQKLAERTPAHERYGSPERQAAQVRAETREAARSPLADHQPGRALADAVARNGAERDGFER